jgi:3-phenylpropionate/cinnamic acid dioxygenase small subunit
MEFDDYLQIQNLLYQYAHYADQADFDNLARLFAHANKYTPHGGPFLHDSDGIAKQLRQWCRVHENGTMRTRHVTTNLLIESDGPDRAKSQCYVVVFQATSKLPLQPVIAGTYLDRFERVDGKWRFSERRELPERMELIGNLQEHLNFPMIAPDQS